MTSDPAGPVPDLEARLQACTKALARSRQDFEQLVYAVSHDLREPVRMVKSYAELLGRRCAGKVDASADEFIHYLTEGADRLRDMIGDLLEYSRVERRAQPSDADPEQALRAAVAGLAEPIERSGAVIEHDPLPRVRCTPNQLAQALQELIHNSIEYRGEQPPRIHVDAHREGNEVILSVHDNGIGFDPDQAARIFGIFQRLHGRGEHPGTGMGLALAKKIVETHGGRIWAQSEPGQGSVFHCALPAAAA